MENFSGEHTPDPLGWADFALQLFFPRLRTPLKSHATPLTFTSLFV